MKNNSLFKYVVLFSILISMSNCSSEDEPLEMIDTPTSNEQIQTKNGGATANCNYEIILEFRFDPGTSEFQKQLYKEQYYLERALLYTICERVASDEDCEDLEKWTVNEGEYRVHHPIPIQGTGGRSTTNPREKNYRSLGGIRPDRNSYCFDDGVVLNTIYGGGFNFEDDSFDNGNGNGEGEGDNGSDGFGNWH